MTQELVANTQAEAAATKTITVLSTTNTTITVHTETNVTSSISVIKEEKIDKESKLYKQCLLFPTYAYWSSRVEDGGEDAGEWTIRINGWIFGFPKRSSRRRLALGITRLLSGLSTTDEYYTHFEQRTRMFFAVNTPDIPVRVQAIGITIPEKFELDGDPVDRIYSEGCASDCSDSDSGSDSSKKKTDIMLKSKKSPLAPPPEGAPSSEIIAESGYLRGHLRIDGDMVKKWHAASDHSNDRTLLKLQAFFAGEPETPNSGVVNLISPHGISVISDIDDTIKMTGILQGVKTVLGNTFFKKTNDVPGMADVYNEWYRKGVAFHYVSNGPWQLYPMLDQFFRDHRFPPGAAHLRMYDGISAVLQDQPGQTKQDRIIDIFNDFPHRRFILVGDSGEKDPEVYAEIARRFPDRVVCIFIHDVTTPMLLEQVQAKLETTIHDGNNNAKTTKEAKSGAETKHETSNEAESFRQRIHNRLSEIKCQFHEDIHESSETVGDMFDWVDNKTDSMQDELSIKVDELAQSTRKAMQEFRQRIHDVFDGLKDWRLFMEAREMLSHEKLHSVFDKPSIAQVEAQELSVRADPLQ